MRSHPNARLAMTLGAMLLTCAAPAIAGPAPEEERKTPPPPPKPTSPPENLPGETNRQFAARMKAEAQ